MTKTLQIVAAVSALALVPCAAQAADWSDTSISYRYGADFSEPAIDKDVRKSIVGLTHVSGFKYGSNFFNADILMSDKADPASNSTSGAQEVYVVYANQLHYSKLSGNKLALGPLSDFAWTTGFDLSAKNTAFAPRVRKLMFGPTLKFGGGFGWADVSLLFYKERNNNGIVGKSVDFDPTYRVAAAWGINLGSEAVPLSLNGFATYTGAKGKDGFGVETKAETLMDVFLMLDVGKVAGMNKGTVLAGVGYEYWKNKFGSNPPTTGTKTSTPMLKVEWHL